MKKLINILSIILAITAISQAESGIDDDTIFVYSQKGDVGKSGLNNYYTPYNTTLSRMHRVIPFRSIYRPSATIPTWIRGLI